MFHSSEFVFVRFSALPGVFEYPVWLSTSWAPVHHLLLISSSRAQQEPRRLHSSSPDCSTTVPLWWSSLTQGYSLWLTDTWVRSQRLSDCLCVFPQLDFLTGSYRLHPPCGTSAVEWLKAESFPASHLWSAPRHHLWPYFTAITTKTFNEHIYASSVCIPSKVLPC